MQRVRFTCALFFSVCLGAEFLTPYLPHLFVPLAGVSNIGKAVSITAYTSTQPAILRSFTRGEHLADVAARCQAQNMVVDQLGIATAAALTLAVRKSARWKMLLPLVRACSHTRRSRTRWLAHPACVQVMYVVCTAGDMTLIRECMQVMYVVCTAGDVTLIHRELKSVHLRTLNRTRAETLFAHRLEHGTVRAAPPQ
jgi:Vitamin B6 photo-protection and homoeostasis